MDVLESFSLSFGVEEDEEEEVWGVDSVDSLWREKRIRCLYSVGRLGLKVGVKG